MPLVAVPLMHNEWSRPGPKLHGTAGQIQERKRLSFSPSTIDRNEPLSQDSNVTTFHADKWTEADLRVGSSKQDFRQAFYGPDVGNGFLRETISTTGNYQETDL